MNINEPCQLYKVIDSFFRELARTKHEYFNFWFITIISMALSIVFVFQQLIRFYKRKTQRITLSIEEADKNKNVFCHNVEQYKLFFIALLFPLPAITMYLMLKFIFILDNRLLYCLLVLFAIICSYVCIYRFLARHLILDKKIILDNFLQVELLASKKTIKISWNEISSVVEKKEPLLLFTKWLRINLKSNQKIKTIRVPRSMRNYNDFYNLIKKRMSCPTQKLI